MRGGRNRQQNVPPSPEAVILPVDEVATAVLDSDNEFSNTPNSTSSPEVNEAEEVEVLPTAEEAETPTRSPTETTVQPTPSENAPVQTSTAESTPTEAPTIEPTNISCVPSPPFGWVQYTIQANDSLSSLSQATGTTIARIQEVNCLDTILLSVGQQIWLPSSPNPVDTPAPIEPTSPAATAVPPGNTPQPPPPTSGPPTPTVPPQPTP